MRKLYKFFTWMLVFIPVAVYMEYAGYPGLWVFFACVLAIVPLSKFLGKATEQVALHSNTMTAGLLNASFGNLIEVVVCVFALYAGLIGLVKASIFGSIIFNMLFLIGLAIFVGGIKHSEQKFDTMSARISTTMLLIAVIGLAMPTIFQITLGSENVQHVSDWVSVVLAITYICGLIFAFYTHKAYFDVIDNYVVEKIEPEWNKNTAMVIMI